MLGEMRFLTSIASAASLFLAGNTSALAHDGLENETEVRVLKDRIEVTVRSSLLFAWKLLGKDAPRDAGEASREKAKPRLKELAAGLVGMTSAGNTLKLRSADCVFELDEHAAFMLVYEMPAGSPEIQFKAAFFKILGGLEEGSFRLLDLTLDPLKRDAEPLARKRLHRADDSFAFACTAQGVRVGVAKPAPASPPAKAPAR